MRTDETGWYERMNTGGLGSGLTFRPPPLPLPQGEGVRSRRAPPRTGAHLHRHPHGSACRGTDPLRRSGPTAPSFPTSSAAARPRRLGHGASGRRSRRRSGVGCSPGPSRSADAKASPALSPRSRRRSGLTCAKRLRLPTRPGAVVTGFVKVEAAIAEKPLAALIHAVGRGRGWAAKARGGVAQTRRRGDIRHSGGRRVFRRRIGFGIRPVKCDTCCPRRGRWQRRISRALASATEPIAAVERRGQAARPERAGDPRTMNPQESEAE